MNLAAFVYDFPHQKSSDLLLRLWMEEEEIACVLGAPHRDLGKKENPRFRVKPRHLEAFHPQALCDRMGILYRRVDHASRTAAEMLREHRIDIGLIGGARILPAEVIEACGVGIVNFHPGLIPEVRGLDALKWAVHDGHPPGVTAHLIDERVDAGRILVRQRLPVFPDDTWVDLSMRLHETEIQLAPKVLEILRTDPELDNYELVGEGRSNTTMTAEQEEVAMQRFASWLSTFGTSG
jgi:phosphoribosylglycinamide formyltransferase-1